MLNINNVSKRKKATRQKYLAALKGILSKGKLLELEFFFPPLSLQIQFAEFVEKVEAQKALLKKSLADMEQNYQSFMQKCFKGEIF